MSAIAVGLIALGFCLLIGLAMIASAIVEVAKRLERK